MPKVIKFFVTEYEGNSIYFTPETLEELGICDPLTVFERGDWHAITLKPARQKEQEEINRRCLIPDTSTGFRYDAAGETRARAAVMIALWTVDGVVVEDVESAYKLLPIPVAAFLDSEIAAHINPSPMANPDFFNWLASRREPSSTVEERRAESAGETSTPA